MTVAVQSTAWRSATLDDVSERIDYGHTASSTQKDVGPKFLRITDIQNGNVQWQNVPFCMCSETELARYSLAKGDIVFARTGATTGKSFLIHDCPEGAVFASYLIRVRPGKGIDPGFLARFFETPRYWAQIAKSASGSTQAGVNSTKLKQLTIPIPPIAEQRRIAAILDKADAIRRKRRQAIELASHFVPALFSHMFRTKDSDVQVLKLQDVVETFIDYRGKTPEKTTTGVPLVTAKIIKEGRILDAQEFIALDNYHEWMRRGYPRTGDVLFTTEAPLGEVAQITDPNVALAQRVLLLRGRSGLLDNGFLKLTLKTPFVWEQIVRRSSGSTVVGIRQKELRQVSVPVPPLTKQLEFTRLAKQQDAFQAKRRIAADAADELFDSLIARAFRGEL